MDLGLRRRVAVVTGGASNIGRAISHQLAAEGAVVAILDRDADMAARTAGEITEPAVGPPCTPSTSPTSTGRRPRSTPSRPTSARSPCSSTTSAGTAGPAFFLDLPPERWEQAFRLNLFPTLNATRAVLPRMVERRAGAIVSISSDAGFGEFRMGDYGPMKAGVMAFSRTIAKEYGRYGIRSNAVCPGLVIPAATPSATAACGRPTSGSATRRSATWRRRSRCASVRRPTTSPPPWPTWRPRQARMLTGQVVSVSGGFSTCRADDGEDEDATRTTGPVVAPAAGCRRTTPRPLGPTSMHNPASRIHVARALRGGDARSCSAAGRCSSPCPASCASPARTSRCRSATCRSPSCASPTARSGGSSTSAGTAARRC